MVHISDYEDKKMTIAYILAKQRNNGDSIASIYTHWCRCWKDDFKVGCGFQPKFYEGKLVLDIQGAKLGAKQPETIKELNETLLDVQRYIKENWNGKIPRKDNANNFKEKKLEYEHSKYKELAKIFYNSGLDENGRYRVWDKTSKKHPNKLGLYAIHDSLVEDRHIYVFIGTFDEVMDYINKQKEGVQSGRNLE